MIWHSSLKEDVLKHYKVDDNVGLANSVVYEKQEIYGKNTTNTAKDTSFFRVLLGKLLNKTGIFLVIVSLIYFFVANSYDIKTAYFGFLAILIVIVNAVISAFHIFGCENDIADIRQTTNPTVKVLRDGVLKTISSVELVPGDIMILEEGDYICADARLIETNDFRCNEVALTGEDIPVNKNADIVFDDIEPINKRSNMVFSSTTAVHGSAKAVVIATGFNTENGKTTSINEQIGGNTLPMQNEMNVAAKIFNILVCIVCVLFFFISILQNFNQPQPFAAITLGVLLNAAALAFAAFPEGLNAISTIVIATGTKRIFSDKIIFKDSKALENIGKTNVICADKTGIFTQNKMILECIYDGKKLANVSNGFIDESSSVVLNLAAACSTLENDTTENAISDACMNLNYKSKTDISSLFPQIAVIPFDSLRKTMTVITIINEQPIAIIKGAPEIVVPNCIDCDIDGILSTNKEIASEGLRNVAIAIKKLSEIPANPKSEDIERGLTFVGILGLNEPIRNEIFADIKMCNDANIKTVMLTGDSLPNAIKIAESIGLLTDEAQAITGSQLDDMTDEELALNIEKYSVFARISPKHKVRIVTAWQANKAVVAVTGDSMQDADALAVADIGCAIGKYGDDVAKGNADVIILKNDFGSIVRAIKESRGIFVNIKKTVYYLFGCNLAELMLLFLGALIFKNPIIFAVQLLLINLLTDCAPALSFSMEKPENLIMRRKGFNDENKILNLKAIITVLLQGLFIALISFASYLIGNIVSSTVATTMAFVTLGISQLLHCYNMKLETSVCTKKIFSNKFMNLSVFTTAFVIVFLVFTPIGFIFGLTVLKVWQFALALALAFLVFPFVELLKKFYIKQ